MTKNSIQTSSHAAYSITYHIVLTIKYRNECINKAMLDRLHEIFSDVSKKWRCKLIEFNGEKDHVHLLVQAHPAMDLSRFIGNLKTVSSRYVRQEFAEHLKKFFWKKLFWNSSYGVFSAGGHASIEQLIEYVRDQESPEK